jgi:hypothetical protein
LMLIFLDFLMYMKNKQFYLDLVQFSINKIIIPEEDIS